MNLTIFIKTVLICATGTILISAQQCPDTELPALSELKGFIKLAFQTHDIAGALSYINHTPHLTLTYWQQLIDHEPTRTLAQQDIAALPQTTRRMLAHELYTAQKFIAKVKNYNRLAQEQTYRQTNKKLYNQVVTRLCIVLPLLALTSIVHQASLQSSLLQGEVLVQRALIMLVLTVVCVWAYQKIPSAPAHADKYRQLTTQLEQAEQQCSQLTLWVKEVEEAAHATS